MKTRALFWLVAAAGLAGATCQAAEWFPVEVNTVTTDGSKQGVTYHGLDKASQSWKICASYPHLKDSFWQATDFGMVEEAKRLKVRLQVMDAGGYPNLGNQIAQIEDCVSSGGNAVIVGAVSYTGLSNLLSELKKKNIPVVDLFNGVSSKDVAARMLAPPYDAGASAGRLLANRHPAGTKPVKVAWLPGPAGAGFVELFNQGFKEAVKGSAAEIVTTKYGDIGKEVQARLVEDILQTHKDLDYVVGTAVTAEAAIPVLRAHNRASRVKVVSLYVTPGVYRGIKEKTIEASVVQPNVISARIAVDQAVRLLEKREVVRHVTEVARMFDQTNIEAMDLGASFAPASFKPIFKVE